LVAGAFAAGAGAGAGAGVETVVASVFVVSLFTAPLFFVVFFFDFFLVVVELGVVAVDVVDVFSVVAPVTGLVVVLASVFVWVFASSAKAAPSDRTATATRAESVFFIFLPPFSPFICGRPGVCRQNP
jgi:hypothetical protein